MTLGPAMAGARFDLPPNVATVTGVPHSLESTMFEPFARGDDAGPQERPLAVEVGDHGGQDLGPLGQPGGDGAPGGGVEDERHDVEAPGPQYVVGTLVQQDPGALGQHLPVGGPLAPRHLVGADVGDGVEDAAPPRARAVGAPRQVVAAADSRRSVARWRPVVLSAHVVTVTFLPARAGAGPPGPRLRRSASLVGGLRLGGERRHCRPVGGEGWRREVGGRHLLVDGVDRHLDVVEPVVEVGEGGDRHVVEGAAGGADHGGRLVAQVDQLVHAHVLERVLDRLPLERVQPVRQ